MTKEMIISSSDHDTRVAILEDDQVVEIFIERERSRGVVGNIYKGRVSKILPGMQSSFIDIGLERDAFLYVSEVVNTVEEFDRLTTNRGKQNVVTIVNAESKTIKIEDVGTGAIEKPTIGTVTMPAITVPRPRVAPSRRHGSGSGRRSTWRCSASWGSAPASRTTRDT